LGDWGGHFRCFSLFFSFLPKVVYSCRGEGEPWKEKNEPKEQPQEMETGESSP
jgi:hypothetical protein